MRPSSTCSRSSRPGTTAAPARVTGASPGPGAAESAITVAAADGRVAAPTVRVQVRAGLRVLYEDDVPLGGAPTDTVTADVVLVDGRTAAKGIGALFTDDGVSAVAGRTVLLPRGALSEDTVEEAASAGALAVARRRPPAGGIVQSRRSARCARRRPPELRRCRGARDARRRHTGDGRRSATCTSSRGRSVARSPRSPPAGSSSTPA